MEAMLNMPSSPSPPPRFDGRQEGRLDNAASALADDGVDLNKVSDEELRRRKDLMEVGFLQNQKRPGDPGFVYDLQVEFNPTKRSEWDSSSSEEEK